MEQEWERKPIICPITEWYGFSSGLVANLSLFLSLIHLISFYLSLFISLCPFSLPVCLMYAWLSKVNELLKYVAGGMFDGNVWGRFINTFYPPQKLFHIHHTHMDLSKMNETAGMHSINQLHDMKTIVLMTAKAFVIIIFAHFCSIFVQLVMSERYCSLELLLRLQTLVH